ncbi:MAG: adenylate/guanylate cyclase domain-containing protein [Leptolyngbya sp.]|nr:adenylate/guanylate cyclase domain-containing protein [Leptolyngbya sp.]
MADPVPPASVPAGQHPTGWRSRLGHIPLLPGVIAATVGTLLWVGGGWEPLERLGYRGLFLTRQVLTPMEWDDRIVVVAIDDISLATYGPYPWPRDRYSNLLNQLSFVQPAAIGLDILFPESTPEDDQLAESLLRNGNGVLAVGDDGRGNAIQVTPTITQPLLGYFQLGHVKHTPDTDGISRQNMLYEIHGEAIAPSFAIALVQTYQTSLDNTLTAEPLDIPQINPIFTEQPQKFDQDHPIWVNWPGYTRPQPDQTTSVDGLTTLSYAALMADNSPLLEELQNKIVIVGYTATGVAGNAIDALRTPFEPSIPTAGVYLHAALVDNLLNNRFLHRLPHSWSVGLIITIGLLSALAFKPLGLRLRLLALASLMPLWFAIAYGGFTQGLWLPIAAPIGTSLLSVLGLQFLEQQERQALMDLFAINLSPQMAEFIWQHKGELLNDGQIRPQVLTATLLFMDIRGFTTISEKLPSDVLLPWLNRYFEVMTDCIMDHGGVVDKYIGDAIMAAFGAPVVRAGPNGVREDAQAAIEACVAMVQALATLNQEFAAQGLPTVKFGIGLHTGKLVAGTVGSRTRASYSLFGDTVNVAARLQDMTKQLAQDTPYPVLMSAATYTQVRDRCQALPKGKIQLRGRANETTVYALAKVRTH